MNRMKATGPGLQVRGLAREGWGVKLAQGLGRQWLVLLRIEKFGAECLVPPKLEDVDPEDRVVRVALRHHVEVCGPLQTLGANEQSAPW
eukprot:7340510-Alexandrium_andersonii.AAC.1